MTAADFYKKVDSLSKVNDFNSLHDEFDYLYTNVFKVVGEILRKRTLREINLGNNDLMVAEKIELLESCESILNKKIQEREEFFSREEKKDTFEESLSMKRYRDFLLEKIAELKKEYPHDKLPVTPTLFKNNFDDTDPNTVYNFFREHLVSNGFLDETTLNEYLILAFEKGELPEKLFKFKKVPSKKRIRKIFGTYYKKIAVVNKYGNLQEYADLLGKYFVGHQIKSLASNLTRDVI